MMKLYLGTDTGLVIGRLTRSQAELTGHWLENKPVTSIAARESLILAGTKTGIFRSEDGGQFWTEANKGLFIPHIRSLAFHPNKPNVAFAGTEPAGIFVTEDGANTWQERSEVSALRDQFGWFLPYSPEAGCVRGFAFFDQTVYAAVEVGGLLRSDDQGANWGLVEGSDGEPHFGALCRCFIHPDVHSVATHPFSPALIYAPTGGGFFVSADGGSSWTQYHTAYCRAVWIDPHDPDHLVLGPADGVNRNGRIEETTDGGQNWQVQTSELDMPWSRHMVEHFVETADELFAILSNGQLFRATIGKWHWQSVYSDIESIRCLAPEL